MSRREHKDPLERMIRRSLKNGIKTMAGKNNQLEPVAGTPSLITYDNDRPTFLTLLQYDAAHLDHTFDQGNNAAAFALKVREVALAMAAEEQHQHG